MAPPEPEDEDQDDENDADDGEGPQGDEADRGFGRKQKKAKKQRASSAGASPKAPRPASLSLFRNSAVVLLDLEVEQAAVISAAAEESSSSKGAKKGASANKSGDSLISAYNALIGSLTTAANGSLVAWDMEGRGQPQSGRTYTVSTSADKRPCSSLPSRQSASGSNGASYL